MKEEKKGFLLFFLFLEGERERGSLWREGEHSGAFFKILYCIQDHKWNAKQGWEGAASSATKAKRAPYSPLSIKPY